MENNHDEKYGVPSLEELHLKSSELESCLYPGGETEALKRLESVLQDEVRISFYIFEYFYVFNSPNYVNHILSNVYTVKLR